MDKKAYTERTEKYLKNVINNHQTSISAAAASVIGTVVGYPFDSIKTRMQTYNYGKMRNCIKLTYKSEGLRGFYRGVGPPLITISIVKSISYSIYNRSKNMIDRYFDPKSLYGLTVSSSAAGAVSGYISAIISCPLELIKMQRQIEQLLIRQSSITASINAETAKQAAAKAAKVASKAAAKNSAAAAVKQTSSQTMKTVTHETTKNVVKSSIPNSRHFSTSSIQTGINIFKANGIHGLYRGFLFQGFRDALGTGSYFCAYEITKKLLTKDDKESSHLAHFFSGGIAGIASWICIFPVDLIKSKLQIDAKSKHKMYKSQLECIKQIYKTGGIKAFYQGISSCLIRAFPVHALNFVVYEHILSLCKKYGEENESEVD
ncbi:mitochondrial carrier [Piromyces finnis]|uniref:Mitochondrial carrier n=1 Tax=Piromyces finnis TaxID=1754191 RepID=A0A1Y1VG06_9FUNG|nr:mitochondrial carrier [Piromyces finnis]|eukprot:ORX55338.1 mitochondrial carrier [Piromyces finnis]